MVEDFDVTASGADEKSRYLRPHLRVMDLAKKKGESVSDDKRLVIASDTIVYRNGKYYGKPKDRQDAVRMLKELSGVWHSVYTGVYLKKGAMVKSFYDRADVLFKNLSDEEIAGYAGAAKARIREHYSWDFIVGRYEDLFLDRKRKGAGGGNEEKA